MIMPHIHVLQLPEAPCVYSVHASETPPSDGFCEEITMAHVSHLSGGHGILRTHIPLFRATLSMCSNQNHTLHWRFYRDGTKLAIADADHFLPHRFLPNVITTASLRLWLRAAINVHRDVLQPTTLPLKSHGWRKVRKPSLLGGSAFVHPHIVSSVASCNDNLSLSRVTANTAPGHVTRKTHRENA